MNTRKHRRLRLLPGALALALASAPAWAQAQQAPVADSNLQLLDILLKNGALTQAQYDQLVQQQTEKDKAQQAEKDKAALDAASSATAAPEAKAAKISPVITGKDSNLTMKIGGRFLVTAATFQNDKNHNNDGDEIRRARFDISGNIYTNWQYMVSVDFADSDAPIKNAYVTYTGMKNTDVILGYFKPDYSLQYQESDNKAAEFSERAMTDAFDTDKRIGVGLFRHVTHGTSEYTASIGLFGEAFPSDGGKADGGYSVNGRATYAFVHTDDRLLHIGASAEWRKPGDLEETSIAISPGLHLANKMLNTGDIANVDDTFKLGAEGTAVYGPLAFEAEYMQENIQRNAGFSKLGFNAWYVEASYFLTDDSRAGAYEQGTFGSIKPRGDKGAWQLALRYDEMDLNDVDIVGGSESNVQAGVNYYVNRYLRFSLDYIKVVKMYRPGNIYDGDKPGMAAASLWLAW